MYKVTVSKEVSEKLLRFIDAYKLSYQERYTDTGLGVAEDTIIARYLEDGDTLTKEMTTEE